MQLSLKAGRALAIAVTLCAPLALSACTASTGFVQTRTQGYVLPKDAIQQVRPGQSDKLVATVLGSPMTTNEFGGQTAWYYVETKVNQTAFGLKIPTERTVLAVYFDKNMKVVDTAMYGLKDGRSITISARRTPSFGADKSFIESIISSI
ncbi:MAG: outer membrane protein assembly factor BamE [Devosia sp.]|nr:outer membrane protein assembly factor BamE [Devosia sp.]